MTHRWLGMFIALVVIGSGCAGTGGPAASRTQKADDGGFTITQDVRVGLGVRADFDAARELVEHGKPRDGIAKLEQITEAAPELVSAHINLGIAHQHVEAWDQAEASLRRALELSPRHPVAHNELGIVLRHLGRFEEARSSYQRALDLAPDFHFARRNLAILCDLFLADGNCALEHYAHYARSHPDDAQVSTWIADLENRGADQGRPTR